MPRPVLSYADPTLPGTRTPSGVDALAMSAISLIGVPFIEMGGLHGERNPIGIAVWLGIAILASALWFRGRSLRETMRCRSSWRVAGVILLVSWILGGLSIALPHPDPHVGMRQLHVCRSNLLQIGQAMVLYANTHNRLYPDRLEDLLSVNGFSPDCLICPANYVTSSTAPSTRKAAYVYLAKGMTSASGAETILAYEPPGNHGPTWTGMHVLFGDGAVLYIRQPQAKRVFDDLKVGRNPPRERLR